MESVVFLVLLLAFGISADNEEDCLDSVYNIECIRECQGVAMFLSKKCSSGGTCCLTKVGDNNTLPKETESPDSILDFLELIQDSMVRVRRSTKSIYENGYRKEELKKVRAKQQGKKNKNKENEVEKNKEDCMDAADRLKCKKTCPEKRRVLDKSCPFNRICCYGKPNSVYLPFRDAPFYKRISSSSSSTDSTFVFPDSVISYILKRYNKTNAEENAINKESNTVRSENNNDSSEDSINAIDQTDISERKSVKACKKYTNLIYEYLHATPSLPKILPFTIPMDKCVPLINPLIVGGKRVTRGQYPHMAALGYNKTDFIDYLCGGTLISEKYILTAAHCAKTKWGKPIVAMLGSPELYSPDGTEIGVANVIPHPDYQLNSYYNDIALIELKEEVNFSIYIRPACLVQPDSKAKEYGSVNIAIGWGKTGQAYDASLHLLKVLLRTINNTECEAHYSSYKRSTLKEGINENLMCALGYKDRYHDTCQGDSGGPLQHYIPGHRCVLEIIAITSFGKSCGSGIPAVYTKVEPYIPWIENIVWS